MTTHSLPSATADTDRGSAAVFAMQKSANGWRYAHPCEGVPLTQNASPKCPARNKLQPALLIYDRRSRLSTPPTDNGTSQPPRLTKPKPPLGERTHSG